MMEQERAEVERRAGEEARRLVREVEREIEEMRRRTRSRTPVRRPRTRSETPEVRRRVRVRTPSPARRRRSPTPPRRMRRRDQGPGYQPAIDCRIFDWRREAERLQAMLVRDEEEALDYALDEMIRWASRTRHLAFRGNVQNKIKTLSILERDYPVSQNTIKSDKTQ